MKLRQALKIFDATATDKELNWRGHTRANALKRYDRTRSAKEVEEYYTKLMDDIGLYGRAYIVAHSEEHAAELTKHMLDHAKDEQETATIKRAIAAARAEMAS